MVRTYDSKSYYNLYNDVCYEIGEDGEGHFADNFYGSVIPHFNNLTRNDFIQTLRVIVAIYYCLNSNKKLQEMVSSYVTSALERSAINLGVKWVDGIFYPTGEELLDRELIEESLNSLDGFHDEKMDIKNALDNYNAKSLYGVVENCYLAVEGLGRKLLSNNKTLIDNKPQLIQLLQFSPYWNRIFANYLNYANEYRRHAGENRHDLKQSEVEAFLYLTCLIIRATLRAYDEQRPTSL